MLQTFHNDQAIKNKYIARVNHHIKADNLIRGIGWLNGKGCAVGCTLENYDYSRYPIELGIPLWLARLEDSLFENMNYQKSTTWPRDFLEAMPLGIPKDVLEKQVKAPFLILVLKSTLKTFEHKKFPYVKEAIDQTIELWKRDDTYSDKYIKTAELAEAAWTARVVWTEEATEAVWAARAATAARAAWAARVVWTEEATAELAEAEKLAEATEAAGATRSAAIDYFADELLRLLKEIKWEEKFD